MGTSLWSKTSIGRTKVQSHWLYWLSDASSLPRRRVVHGKSKAATSYKSRHPRMAADETEETEANTLLALAADGDVASWGQLLTHSVDRLARFISLRLDRRLQGRIDAEDVIQEIYVEAWRHFPEYRQNSTLPFYLWLRGVARNKMLELHRHHLGAKMRDARRETQNVRHAALETTSAALSSMFVDSNTSPSGAAAREEVRIRLQDALETMDAIDREVLILRHFEQLSPAETALVLQINEKAAGMRYLRAVKRLRQILSSLPGGLSGLRL